ncbi:MAG: cell division protein ZapA [Bryobacteraceae bacterium]
MEHESGARQQVRVTILNQSFTLVTQGDPNEMIELANYVDELMDSVARKSPNLDATRVAVFACLHLADQLRSRDAEVDSRVRQLGSLLDQALGVEAG